MSHTLHGTGIHAYIEPPNHPQLIGIYGSPMERLGISLLRRSNPAVLEPRSCFGVSLQPAPASFTETSMRRETEDLFGHITRTNGFRMLLGEEKDQRPKRVPHQRLEMKLQRPRSLRRVDPRWRRRFGLLTGP